MEKGKIISITSGVVIILGIVFIIFSFISIPGMKKNVPKQAKTASTYIPEIRKDSLVIVQVKQFLSSYSRMLNRHNPDSISLYFADSLKRFYLRENVNNRFISEYYKGYWAKFPESNIKYNFDEILIDVSRKGDIQVVLQGEHYRDKKNTFQFLAHFRLNDKMKIYYLRDFKSS